METRRLRAMNKCRVYVPTWLLLAVICQSADTHTYWRTFTDVCGRHITHTPGLHGDNATVGNICVKYFLCVNDNKRINLSMLLPPPVTRSRPFTPPCPSSLRHTGHIWVSTGGILAYLFASCAEAACFKQFLEIFIYVSALRIHWIEWASSRARWKFEFAASVCQVWPPLASNAN